MKRILTTVLLSALTLCACDSIITPPTPDPDPKPDPATEIRFAGSKEAPKANFTSKGGDYVIDFQAPKDWTASVDAKADWCTVSPTSGAEGAAKISITATENSEYEVRQTIITLSSGNDKKQIQVSQSQKGALLLDCESQIKMSVLGGSFSINIDYNIDFEYSSDSSWLHEEKPETKGLKSKELIFVVEANESGATRSGKLTFSSTDGSLSEVITVEQGHEITITEGEEIDLGLSVKWARTNLGATNPEDRGLLFAWGETQTHKNDKFYGDDYARTMNPYYRPSGTTDTRKHLSDDDDAATMNLGNKWRMPTQDEIFELRNLNYAYPFNYQGNRGILLQATNGNTLFFPATGYELGYQAPEDNRYEVVCFWTNEVSDLNENQALCLCSHIRGSDLAGLPFLISTPMMMERFAGLPVRAVRRADIIFGEFQAEVSETSATLTVPINLDGIEVKKVKKAGFLISKYTDLFIAPEYVDSLYCSPTESSISCKLEGLSSSSNYKVRPFLVVEKEGNYTGSVCEFTTKAEPKPEQWVDLGLSVLWASWNLGTTELGEYGDVFQWADPEPKDRNKSYTDGSYKFYDKQKKFQYTNEYYSEYYHIYFKKYSSDDELTQMQIEDDPAAVIWGDGARTPSREEWKELIENCNIETLTKYGTQGHLLTSKKNGAYIFLPSFYGENSAMYHSKYWSSDLKTERYDVYPSRNSSTILETVYDYSKAYSYEPNYKKAETTYSPRSNALAIRAVKNK